MTYVVAALIVYGTALELVGIATVALDVRQTALESRKRWAETPSMMALNKAHVAWWFDRAGGDLERRGVGVAVLAIGVVVQMAAHLLALS